MKTESVLKMLNIMETDADEGVSEILKQARLDIENKCIFNRMYTLATPFRIKECFSDIEISACLDGRPIEAINMFRKRTGCSTNEAKNLATHVRENEENYRILIGYND